MDIVIARRSDVPTRARAAILVALMASLGLSDARAGDTQLVSAAPDGGPGDAASGSASGRNTLTSNGRWIAFDSDATNLVEGDANAATDVFVRDRKKGTTLRASVAPEGETTGGGSLNAFISANGRYVAFQSSATNLVDGDANGAVDIFMRDLKQGLTTRVSVDSLGAEADGASFNPSLSANGRFVVFQSSATNLVEGDGNGNVDIFVHDLKTGTTTCASVDPAGLTASGDSIGASISANGRWVVFESLASTLVVDDGNGFQDVFRRDLKQGVTDRVSLDAAGAEANGTSFSPRIAGAGRFVVFGSNAPNLVAGDVEGVDDIFVRDLKLGTVQRVSVDGTGLGGNNPSGEAWITGNGRYVSFESGATNLMAGDSNGKLDVFVADRKKGVMVRASLDALDVEADDDSARSAVSDNGRFVVFDSLATNLVAGDDNAARDVFVRDTK